ncbi:MAG: Carnitine operon protein CaiE [Alphaproteobacteria bacterium MarineAlpha9_Bin4]|nr:MAG: Carnitine operon protein CaiE [Alphaproteobacteria bacterium MarineAlpha9_Bin4]
MALKIIKYLNYIPCLKKKVEGKTSSIVIGNTFISESTKLGENVIVRGDGKKIYIGKNCFLKNRVTIHVASELQGTEIGNNCIIDEYSIIHACQLGNNVLIGSNSVVMDEGSLGNNVVVTNNSLVPPGKKFPSNCLIGGSPAKIIKKINKNDYLNFKRDILLKEKSSFFYNDFNYRNFLISNNIKKKIVDCPNNCFVAFDASVKQKVIMGQKSSIWYSVAIFSTKKNGKLLLGNGSNIQDNSIINTLGEIIKIGKRVTVGHNVIISGKTEINDDAVIGMGSILEKNCVIGNNSFVGANSYVKEGTIIPDSTIFAGKPARFFRNVNQEEKIFFKKGQKIYENLAKEYTNEFI